MNSDIYYIVELMSILDNIITPVLCNETVLADFISNYDKTFYKVTNVYGIGAVKTDYTDFLKKEEGLEKG